MANFENREIGKRTGRRQLRGKPLLGSCQRAHISHNELPGVDACYGLTDWNPGAYNGECRKCGALVWNVDLEQEAKR